MGRRGAQPGREWDVEGPTLLLNKHPHCLTPTRTATTRADTSTPSSSCCLTRRRDPWKPQMNQAGHLQGHFEAQGGWGPRGRWGLTGTPLLPPLPARGCRQKSGSEAPNTPMGQQRPLLAAASFTHPGLARTEDPSNCVRRTLGTPRSLPWDEHYDKQRHHRVSSSVSEY